MSRPALIGIIGLLVLLVAGTLNLWLLPQEEEFVESATSANPPPSQTGTGATENAAPKADADGTGAKDQSTDQAASKSSDQSTAQGTAPQDATGEAGKSAADTTAATPTEPEMGPTFDIVRVDPEGNAVIAGRGAPNARISILDGDKEIGNVTTDGRGEWVFIPSERLASGESVIRLKETGPDGTERDSDAAVVLVVPEVGKDIAGNASAEPGTPLAVLVPKDEKGEVSAATVLQAPSTPQADAKPKVQQPETTSAASNDENPVQSVITQSEIKPTPSGADVTSAPLSGQNGPASPAETMAEAPADASPGASAPDNVSVEIIDYNDKGSVVFSGKSQPGSDVEVFVDDKSVGKTVTDSRGDWSMTPDEPVAPGSYDLRVEKKSADGLVEARVQLPFVRARAIDALPQDRLVVIQPGNNLWTIALKVYGEGTRYVQIHQANSDQIRDPDMIFPGQIFGLPSDGPTTTN